MASGATQSDVTASANYYWSFGQTAAAAFTLASMNHFIATQGTFGAGSTVTNQYGFHASNGLTGGANNYGFYGNIPSAATNWNIYCNGTAKNYLNGKLLIGSNTDATADKVQVTGDVKITGNLTVTGSASISGGGGDGGFAFKYTFDTGTGGSPASGNVQLNNATPASATFLYINETDANGILIDNLLDDMVQPDWIMLSNADRSKFHVFTVDGMFVSGATVDPIPVIYQFGTATNFSASETVYFSRSVTSPMDVVSQNLMVGNSRYIMWA
jgi:hypothetical protein